MLDGGVTPGLGSRLGDLSALRASLSIYDNEQTVTLSTARRSLSRNRILYNTVRHLTNNLVRRPLLRERCSKFAVSHTALSRRAHTSCRSPKSLLI